VDEHIGNETASDRSIHLRNDGRLSAPSGEAIALNNLSQPQKLSLPRRLVLNTLLQMGHSNYIVQATVAIENPQSISGNEFKFVSAESANVPALVKLDTGSDIDIVSQEFLEQAGFNKSLLQPIPAEEAEAFVTIAGKEYKPEAKVRLSWYMEGEQRFRRNTFYVVNGAPVDLLLSSKQFARLAAKRVAIFSRAPKSTGE